MKQFLLHFPFINKTLRLNNLKTRTNMNAKISLFVICAEAIIICYYIICMTIPLRGCLYEKKLVPLSGISRSPGPR